MPKRNSQITGVILDEPYSNGLLVKALQSGQARISFDSDYTRKIRTKALNPKVGQKALEMLLLYDKAYLGTPFDNMDLEPLVRLGLVEYAPHTWDSLAIEEDHAKSIKALLLADLRRKGFKITSKQFDDILGEANDIHIGTIAVLAERLLPQLEHMLGVTDTTSDKYSVGEILGLSKQLQAAQKRELTDIKLVEQIQYSYNHMRNLIEASAQLNAPILTNIPECQR
ncbi:MAG TPA: hypothetical protein VN207_11620 [Ktedonobacteraceae bacterium]|nr:hypothetical protein [Ktedonobacteraceae bacterium]